jgi:hypothetical protein
MSNKIQVVRALWGWDSTKLKKEIPESPIFDNEIVYVWGKYHYDYLLNRGYNCIFVKDEYTKHPFNFLTHKVESFDFAFKDFGSFLYVDWDVNIIKPLDNLFWYSFNDKLFSTSLYPFSKSFFNKSYTYDSEYNHILKMVVNYYNLGWDLEDSIIFPNCGITYFSSDSYDIYKYNRKKYPYLFGLPDEFLIYLMANCNLETYIKNYTNNVMFGRTGRECLYEGPPHRNYVKLFKWFNNYINNNVDMNIYLEHP